MTLIESERRAQCPQVWDKLSVSPQGCTSKPYANLGWLGMRWDTKGGGGQEIAKIAEIAKIGD